MSGKILANALPAPNDAMKQLSFAQAAYASNKKVTNRERFLAEMEQIIPWAALLGMLKP